jgi:hypothetical protein
MREGGRKGNTACMKRRADVVSFLQGGLPKMRLVVWSINAILLGIMVDLVFIVLTNLLFSIRDRLSEFLESFLQSEGQS